jgi:hypothetical protein
VAGLSVLTEKDPMGYSSLGVDPSANYHSTEVFAPNDKNVNTLYVLNRR